MRIDLFTSTYVQTSSREAMSKRCLKNYQAEPVLDVTVFDAGSTPQYLEWLKAEGFRVVSQPQPGSLHRRFLLAEVYARSEIYLFSDDDILPLTPNWLGSGLEIMRSHPGFGMLVTKTDPGEWAYDHGFIDKEVKSIIKGGGLFFIRRDIRTAPYRVPWIFNPNSADDWEYCEAIKKSGLGLGMFQNIRVEHLGRAESTIPGYPLRRDDGNDKDR